MQGRQATRGAGPGRHGTGPGALRPALAAPGRHPRRARLPLGGEDPYRAEFRRWVPGTPGLPEGADALLRARAQARKSDDDAEDARELRRELLRLGVVVRDEEKRQYWRIVSE
ncbi:hypothetical protein ACIGPN_16200 [Streptomyces afghaniensis]|uniref:CysS/YqeB C-terminal domain-containing protein n=1 Tax=Streptomyces afghaniensis TaxID=66865 RepID=UPI0037D0C2BC